MAKGEDITTKFKVDISDLKKGITEANNQIKLANAQFKAASAGMDDWAKSSDGIKAKLTQLSSVLDAQKSKLKSYKDQQQALKQSSEENAKRAEQLKTKLQELVNQGVSKASQEYKNYEKALKEVEKEQQANETAANNLKVTILNQQAAVNKTEKEMNQFEGTLTDVEEAEKRAAKSGKSVEDELRDLEDASNDASDGFTVMKGALANLVADGFRKAIDAAKEFAKEMITTAATVKAETAMFEQTFGDLGDKASAAIKRVADSSGILETRLNVAGARLYAFARSNGGEATESLALMEEALQASADSAAYYDKSLDETTETMMSFLKGNFANDAALGISATEFTRNAKATELFGKKYNELTEFQKQQTLLKMVTDAQKVSGAFGQASRESDGWENVMGNLNETWRQFQAKIGTPFLEALIPIIKNLTDKFKKWADTVDWDAFGVKVKKAINIAINVIKTLINVVSKIINIFNKLKPILITVGTAILAYVTYIKAASLATSAYTAILKALGLTTATATVKTIAQTTAQKALNTAMKANPVGLVVAGIAALTAGIIALIKHENEETKALKEKTAMLKEETKKVQELVDSRKELSASVNQTIADGTAELNYVQSLKNELDGLVDENGRVKDGYEARANFIVGELTEATGVEISLIDGQIQKYGELSKTIDAIIQKKKAELVMEANEDLYKDAIKTRQNAYNEMYRIENEQLKVKEEIEEKKKQILEAGNSFEIFQYAKQLDELLQHNDELQTQYEAQQGLAEDNAYIIGSYEQQMVDFQAEAYDKIVANDLNLAKHKSDKNKTDKEIAGENYAIAQKELDTLIELRNQATNEEKKIYDQQIENAQKHVDETKTKLDALTSTVETGNQKATKKWYAGISDQLDTIVSRKGEFETAGENLINGVNSGISNQNKQSSAYSSIARFGTNLLNKLKASLQEHSPSKATDKMGQYLLEGLGLGIDKKENSVVKQVTDFGRELLEDLQEQLSEDVIVNPNIKGNLQGLKANVGSMSSSLNKGLTSSLNGVNNSNSSTVVNNFNQIINAPKQPSRIELYRQTRNLLELKGGV